MKTLPAISRPCLVVVHSSSSSSIKERSRRPIWEWSTSSINNLKLKMKWPWNLCSIRSTSESVSLMLASARMDSLYSSLRVWRSMKTWLVRLNQAIRKKISTRLWSSWRIALSTSRRRKNSSRATNGTALTVESTSWPRRFFKSIRLRRYWYCTWRGSRTRECSKSKRTKQRLSSLKY